MTVQNENKENPAHSYILTDRKKRKRNVLKIQTWYPFRELGTCEGNVTAQHARKTVDLFFGWALQVNRPSYIRCSVTNKTKLE